jgi:hypothetical protein
MRGVGMGSDGVATGWVGFGIIEVLGSSAS